MTKGEIVDYKLSLMPTPDCRLSLMPRTYVGSLFTCVSPLQWSECDTEWIMIVLYCPLMMYADDDNPLLSLDDVCMDDDDYSDDGHGYDLVGVPDDG